MRKLLYIFLLTTFFIGGVSTSTVYAQNPKQTKKRKKKAKKMAKPKDEPIPYAQSKKRDNDGDGVPNYYDHCPNSKPGENVTSFGCPPNDDGDGLFNHEDKCPNEYGPKENDGCPYGDKDGDGILDKDDMCPDTPGPKKWNGCGDRDGDGVRDSEDKCPDEPGLVGLQGCAKQAEDTDKDGLLDKDDKCPFVAGPIENQGCPEFTDEELRILQAAFENLLFESNSAVIQQSSYESLNGLAEVMVNNEKATLYLEGHTDNVGDDDKNMQLSKDRAASVKKYLTDAGVAGNRITTAGFGETRPVASNDTSDGRRQNRRVMMELGF